MRKLAFWGIGYVYNNIRKWYGEIIPDVFIDTYSKRKEYYGVKVLNPRDIDNWKEYFIVITTDAFDQIKHNLNEEGLEKDKDYALYREYFGIKHRNIDEFCRDLNKWHEENRRNTEESITAIFAPIFDSRNSDMMVHFFREYAKKNSPDKTCIAFVGCSQVSEEKATEILGMPVFILADLSEEINQGICLDANVGRRSFISYMLELKRYFETDREELELSYVFYEKIISIIEPTRLILWGSGLPAQLILRDIAQKKDIEYRFLEYGWIPGTINVDIGGFEERRTITQRLRKIDHKYNTKEIIDYIISAGLDNGKRLFVDSEMDANSLKRINSEKRTIFLAGMDDEGMAFNPNHSFWKENISCAFSSTRELLKDLIHICKKEDWNLVFKPHPNELGRDKLIPEWISEGSVVVQHTSLDKLIEMSDATVCISSVVNYKVLIHNKPLIQCGYTPLFGENCAYDVTTPDNLEKVIEIALDQGVTDKHRENFCEHLQGLLNTCLWDDLSDRRIRYGLTLDRDFFE